jgi:hypothetical protein
MSGTARAIAAVVTVLAEAIVIWRVLRALNRGVIKIDPLLWLTDMLGSEFTVIRARNPLWYWFGIVTTLIVGLVVLLIGGLIVTGIAH